MPSNTKESGFETLIVDTLVNSNGYEQGVTTEWLAHQLVTLKNDSGKEIFETVIVVTDRINLDKQIKDTIKQFMQVSATVGWAKSSGELKQLLNEGKKNHYYHRPSAPTT
ncbi:MAG: hypothetical protein KH138_14220 [Firmicutes bacterium]|nr:hypothetical protein [Bacillota bacterium]